MLEEQRELGIGMLKYYKKFAEAVDDEYFEEVVETEKSFTIPIKTPEGNLSWGRYSGTIDGIVKDELGQYWLLEHKTASRISTDHLPLDEQIVRYIWAAQEEYGLKLEGVIYNIIRKKIPKEPKELKSGGLSKSKSISTTWSKYKKSLIEYYGGKDNVPWDEYEDVLESLEDGWKDFYYRKRIRKSQAEIENIKRRTYIEYKQMRNAKEFYPTPNRNCMWDCDFRHVCIEMNNGTDVEFMLEEMYEERERR